MSHKVVVAPNAFRGSLDAFQAASIIGSAFKSVLPESDILEIPISDGGDCTVLVLQHFLGGEIGETEVSDALGNPVPAKWAILGEGKEAVIEVSEASGFRGVDKRHLDPMTATSFGTGQLIKAALDRNCRRITLGLGGSATTDAGGGALQALGVKLLDRSGNEIGPGGGSLADLDSIDLSQMDPRIHETEFIVACDVDVRLFGNDGAALMFSPQKGASPEQAKQLDNNLRHFSEVVSRSLDKNISNLKYGGASGGIGSGLYAACSATLISGIELILGKIGFEDYLEDCDFVITGEGKFDAQSLKGKAPLGVARAAKKSGIPVILIAGQIDEAVSADAASEFDAVFLISNKTTSLQESMASAPVLLRNLSEQIARRTKMFKS